jgi:hypothetical protein
VTTAVEGAAVLLADVELAELVALTLALDLLRAAAYGYAANGRSRASLGLQ